MTLDEFKTLAAGIQSAMIAIAVVIGGAWALYRFFSLKTIEKAKADLLKTKGELNKRGILEINYLPSLILESNNENGYILVPLKIKNCGQREEVINWQSSSVKAQYVTHRGAEEPTRDPPLIGYQQLIGAVPVAVIISPGQTEKNSFIIPIDKLGTYLISVRLQGSPQEIKEHQSEALEAGISSEHNFIWGSSTYFHATKTTLCERNT